MTEPVNDNEFVLMRHIGNGVVASYPRHYLDHPVFGSDLELYTDEIADEYEEDKVVIEGHQLPVDQRVQIIAKPLSDFSHDELKGIAGERGLKTSGSKSDLIGRIEDDNEEESK